MREIWKNIAGIPKTYFVSDLGRIKSMLRYKAGIKERILKRYLKNGYPAVSITIVSCFPFSFYVHRLMAIAFIPNPENKPEVNHINGIKADCRICNLEWVTHKENFKHAVAIGLIKSGGDNKNSKLNNSEINYIKRMKGKRTNTDLSIEFGVSRTTISEIFWGRAHKRNWTLIGKRKNVIKL